MWFLPLFQKDNVDWKLSASSELRIPETDEDPFREKTPSQQRKRGKVGGKKRPPPPFSKRKKSLHNSVVRVRVCSFDALDIIISRILGCLVGLGFSHN